MPFTVVSGSSKNSSRATIHLRMKVGVTGCEQAIESRSSGSREARAKPDTFLESDLSEAEIFAALLLPAGTES